MKLGIDATFSLSGGAKVQLINMINIKKQCPHLLNRAIWQVLKFYLILPKFLFGKILKQEHKERIKAFLGKK